MAWLLWLVTYLGIAALGAAFCGYLALTLECGGKWFWSWEQTRRRPAADGSRIEKERIEDTFQSTSLVSLETWFYSGIFAAIFSVHFPSLRDPWAFALIGVIASIGRTVYDNWGFLDPIPLRGLYFVFGPGLLGVARATRRAFGGKHPVRNNKASRLTGRADEAHPRPVIPKRALTHQESRRGFGQRFRDAFFADSRELTPALLNEVYAMLNKDPLLFARAKKNVALSTTFVVFLLASSVVVLLYRLGLRYFNPNDEGGAIWWVLTIAFVICACVVIIFHVDAAREDVAAFKSTVDRLKEEAQKAYAGRAELRTKTRQFAEKLENEYRWVREMDENHQKQQALLWYDQIVNAWAAENREWEALRAPDERDLVVDDLNQAHNGLGTLMLTTWERRLRLYHYAYRYVNDEHRAREQARLHEAIELEKSAFDDRQEQRADERARRKSTPRPQQSPEDAL